MDFKALVLLQFAPWREAMHEVKMDFNHFNNSKTYFNDALY